MTSTQVLNRCRKIDPNRAYMAQVEHWHHVYAGREPKCFALAVLPGCDGTTCERFKGASYSECLKKFSAAIKRARA